MAPAVAGSDVSSSETWSTALSREEVLARYRRLREISMRHHDEVLTFIATDAILGQARRLGLADGGTLVLDNADEMNYVFDLTIYTAPPGRSRAIDRYARSARVAPGSDEGLMLRAMQSARFSVLHVERRHEVVGLIANDLFRQGSVWLVDVGLESSMPDGALLATRLYTPEPFSMTAGVIVPFDADRIESLATDLPGSLRGQPLSRVIDDRRFAETLYLWALADGVGERITYRTPDTIG